MRIGRAIATVLLMGSFLINAVGAKGAPASNDGVESSKWATLQKIAVALGFKSWRDDGFWQAYQAAVTAEAERIERERLAGAQAIVDDAMVYGRRVESAPIEVGDSLTVVEFVEYVLPPDGDIMGALMRTGTDHMQRAWWGGVKITRTVSYFAQGNPWAVAQVVSEIADGVETVIGIQKFGNEKAVDLHVGDQRPAPSGESGKAGQRPQTLDPKSDGSMGVADQSAPRSGTTSDSGASSNPSDPGAGGAPDASGTDGSSGSDP